MVLLLLSHGATVKLKNKLGWTPLAEAVSYGNRNTVSSLLTKMQEQLFGQSQKQVPRLSQKFETIPDFEMTLQWNFHTWLPLLSRLLPSDVCKIKKKGNKIRLDSTLLDFSDSRWQKGDVTFIFTISKNQPLILMDNSKKVVQYINSKTPNHSSNKDFDVDFLMSHSTIYATLQAQHISFNKTLTGFFSQTHKTESIGSYTADCYTANNLVLLQKKRREHLPADRDSNKSLFKVLQHASAQPSELPPLPPPPPSTTTWQQYINCPPSQHPPLSRPIISKEISKQYRAYIAMSKDFPLQTHTLLDLLELMAPMKHFNKLREFLNTKLPPGFPIKVEIPILPTITATAMFTEFEWTDSLPDDLFTVPPSYTQAPLNI